MKLAYALCGSFCTHGASLSALKVLAAENVITPILSEITRDTDTRFGRADTLREAITCICGSEPILSIRRAEEIITVGNYDALIVAPCTGNTLAKLSLGISDTPVTLAAKAHLRNRRPLVLALASNDALSANFRNLATLYEKKNVFFVPLRQDDIVKKPSSLVCDFAQLPETITEAMAGRQKLPLFV